MFVMLARLFIAALWSPAGKGLTSLLLFVMLNCDFVTFPCGILGQVWYSIVWIPDLCRLSYFYIGLLSLFMKTNGKYNNSHAPSTALSGILLSVRTPYS